jgi:hypothetical protein
MNDWDAFDELHAGRPPWASVVDRLLTVAALLLLAIVVIEFAIGGPE